MFENQSVYVLNNNNSGGGVGPGTTVKVQATGGWDKFRNIDLGLTGEVIKDAQGQIGGYFIYNNGNTPVYVKFYDLATVPTEADTPALTITIPSQSAANLLNNPGIEFATGIAWRASLGVDDSDTNAPSTNQVVANVFFA